MRSFIVMAMFVASLTHAAMNDYTETRYLELDASDIEVLSIDAGAGSMDIQGVANARKITVKATIEVPDADADEAMKIIEKKMQLSLEQDSSVARLNASFKDGFMGFGSSSARIDIEVHLPQGGSEWRWERNDPSFVERMGDCVGGGSASSGSWNGLHGSIRDIFTPTASPARRSRIRFPA